MNQTTGNTTQKEAEDLLFEIAKNKKQKQEEDKLK